MDLKVWFAKLIVPSHWLDQFFTRPVLSEKICTDCGHVASPVRQRRGDDKIEVGLWCLLAIAGLAYVFTSAVNHFLSWRVMPGMIIRGFSMLTKLFLLLSPIYTLWRISTEYEACPKCHNPKMIPLDSPRGRQVQAQNPPRP